MLGLNICIFALGLLIKLLRFPPRFVNFIGKDLFFGFTVFNVINFGYSFGIHINYYFRDNQSFYINNVCIFGNLAMVCIAAFIYATKQDEEFSGYTIHYKENR
jgi:hypothetical protein